MPPVTSPSQNQSDMPAKQQSLALRLVSLAAGGSLLALLLAGFVMAALQRAGAERAFDERLSGFITQLFADYANNDVFDATAHFANPSFGLPGSGWYWAVADPVSAEPIFASASLFDPLPGPLNADQQATPIGTRSTTVTLGDQTLRLVERVFVFEEEQILVRVSAPTRGLDAELERFRIALALTLGAMWIALLVLAFVQVRIGLRPLKTLQDAVSDVRTAKTSQVQGAFPQEVSPLVDELNGLLKANDAIVERARHHVGNLAHALKTPLAVIQNATQTPSNNTPPPADVLDRIASETLAIQDRVRLYLDRAQRAANHSGSRQATTLVDVVEPLVRTIAKLNRAQGLDFKVDVSPSLRAKADQRDLEEMLGNLLENAAKFASGTVCVTATAQKSTPPMLAISIEDDGDGLSEKAREQVLQRGKRLDEKHPGSGLGLSIVKEMAELYGGSFVLQSSAMGGLRAVVLLPAAAAVPPDS